jgi:hypothetical protein
MAMLRYFNVLIASLFSFSMLCHASAVDTTNKPQVVVAESAGNYILSAYKGHAHGPAIKYMPEWEAFGWFTAEDSVVWDVEIDKAGRFDVHLTWSVSDEEAGKKFTFIAGNDRIDGTVDRSGSWETFKTVKIGTVSLKRGRHKAVFKPFEKFNGEALLDLKEIRLERK